MDLDRVLTVNEYYDGPRLGVAEFNGVPHIYEAQFDHSGEEYGDTYFLSPIDSSLLALVMEDWAIWLRWQAAYKSGHASHDSHPALSSDRARHEELKSAIGNQLKSDPVNRSLFRAKFTAAAPSTAFDGFTVEWHAS